jgi:hypothetical protein
MPKLIQVAAVEYIGGDISSVVINEALEIFPAFDLRVFDITEDKFLDANVWHCRDCIFHLPLSAIKAVLANFSKSKIPYALITSHRSFLMYRNLDVNFRWVRVLDLERSPICLPPPIVRMPDSKFGIDCPRYVCLWSPEIIASVVSSWGPHLNVGEVGHTF